MCMCVCVKHFLLLQVFFVSGFGGNANLTFDPTSEILCQLVSELHLLSE